MTGYNQNFCAASNCDRHRQRIAIAIVQVTNTLPLQRHCPWNRARLVKLTLAEKYPPSVQCATAAACQWDGMDNPTIKSLPCRDSASFSARGRNVTRNTISIYAFCCFYSFPSATFIPVLKTSVVVSIRRFGQHHEAIATIHCVKGVR